MRTQSQDTLRASRRADGRCFECDAVVTTGTRCVVHQRAANTYYRKLIETRRAKGLCVRCGLARSAHSVSRCDRCLRRDRLAHAAVRALGGGA